jgi:CTP:molybdopterin cytidylyltransferase MocA
VDIKTAAVILCAGVGSRMGLPGGINKCALRIGTTTPIRHTVSALIKSGVDDVFIVLGYEAESVKATVSEYNGAGKINFVYNEFYDYHGCEYSLSCGVKCISGLSYNRLIIAEGDSLLSFASINNLINSSSEAASLVRSASYIDYKRSVIAIGTENMINRYEYDTGHKGVPPILSDCEKIIGESMQLWMFSGAVLQELTELLINYNHMANQSETPMRDSGLYSINRLGMDISPVFSDKPDEWINLNTKKDVKKAKEVLWLIK